MFKFKKIASVLTSAVMMSSTIALAAAANYPSPFVTAGSPDVALVYGANAQITDLAAATNIMTDLQGHVTTTTTTTTTYDCGDVDCVLLAKSSDNLNLGNDWSVFTGTITDDDMSTLLADGTYTADDSDTFDYEQKITLGAPTLTHFQEDDYESSVGLDESTPTLGFKISSGTTVMNYTLDFTADAESAVTSGDLSDFEGSDLPLFGKTYYVSDFKNGTSATYLGKLTLLDSATVSSVEKGETVSVTLGDTTYEIGIDFIDSSNVRYIVDGNLVPPSGKLQEGQTRKIADDVYIGARTIDYNAVAGEVGKSTFSLGSGKLEITSGSALVLNDASIQEVKGYVYQGTGSSGSEKIDRIVIEWIAEEDEYLSPDLDLTMPGFGTVKFTMNDFIRSEEDKITIKNDATSSIKLTAPIKDGEVTINLLYAETATGNFTGIGKKSTEKLVTTPASSLTYNYRVSGSAQDRYFIASYASTSQAESYKLRATNFIKGDSTNGNKNKTTIQKDTGGGNWVDVCKERVENDACNVGDVSLTIGAVAYSSDGNTKNVAITAGSNVNFSTMYTTGGLKIYLPYEVANSTLFTGNGAINFTSSETSAGYDEDSWYLFMDGENKDDTLESGVAFNFTIDNTAGTNKPLHISEVSNAGTGGPNGKEVGDSTNTYETYIVDDVAPRILHYTNPDEDWAEVYYPTGDSESYAEVFLTEAEGIIASGTTTSGGTTVPVPILDSEVSSGMNLIVVGGTCVNTVAADLLGVSTGTCGADWETATGVSSGSYLIETFSRDDGKIATLVAGYNAGDTTNAATALRTQTIDTTAGTKYTGTTSSNPVLEGGAAE